MLNKVTRKRWHKSLFLKVYSVRFCWHRQLTKNCSEKVFLLSQGAGSILPIYKGSVGYIGSIQSRNQSCSRLLLQLHLHAREYQCEEVRHIQWGSNAGMSQLPTRWIFTTQLTYTPLFLPPFLVTNQLIVTRLFLVSLLPESTKWYKSAVLVSSGNYEDCIFL